MALTHSPRASVGFHAPPAPQASGRSVSSSFTADFGTLTLIAGQQEGRHPDLKNRVPDVVYWCTAYRRRCFRVPFVNSSSIIAVVCPACTIIIIIIITAVAVTFHCVNYIPNIQARDDTIENKTVIFWTLYMHQLESSFFSLHRYPWSDFLQRVLGSSVGQYPLPTAENLTSIGYIVSILSS